MPIKLADILNEKVVTVKGKSIPKNYIKLFEKWLGDWFDLNSIKAAVFADSYKFNMIHVEFHHTHPQHIKYLKQALREIEAIFDFEDVVYISKLGFKIKLKK